MTDITIRHAVVDDIDEIVEMGKEFWKVTPYAPTGMEYDPATVVALLERLLEEHYLVVADSSVGIVGFMGFFVIPFVFNQNYTVAQEVFFWIAPSYRGALGKDFLKMVEEDIKDFADFIAMGELSTSKDMEEYYTGLGYTRTEQVYSKVL